MLDMTYDPRAAGEIRRYHTWSVIRDQTVGEHTWQILRILLTVWPGAPRRMMIHTVVHDMPEMAGDISYPFKAMFPELRQGMAKAEAHITEKQCEGLGRPRANALSEYEHLIFKLCEWIEMWEYGLHEFNMGNRYGEIISRRMMNEIGPALHKLDTELRNTKEASQWPDIPAAVHKYILERMKMENPDGK